VPEQPPTTQEKDLLRLKKMLRRVLGNDEAAMRRVFEAGGSDALRVLDIACGSCKEAETLAETFAEIHRESDRLPADSPPDFHLTGVDIRAREISDARRRFGGKRKDEKTGARREAEFLVDDATRLDRHRLLGDGASFDVVLLRHQNYWDGNRTWEEIFDQALHQLDPDGRLIITSYSDQEHGLALDAIERLGGEVTANERNGESREIPQFPGQSVDRHVAAFRKPET
jgi:SAM-dependent methyltransferase